MYKTIFNLKELQNYLADTPIVAFDFETAPDEKYRNEDKASLDSHKSHIVGMSFSITENDGVYLPITHRIGENATDLSGIWAWLSGFFTDTSIIKIAHNLAFESQFLYARGIVRRNHAVFLKMSLGGKENALQMVRCQCHISSFWDTNVARMAFLRL